MGIGALRAIAGPDRVAPNGFVLGLDGTRSTTPSGSIQYDWRMIQVPEGDPHLIHYPQAGFPGPFVIEPETIRVDGTTVDLNCDPGSAEVHFSVGGFPFDLTSLPAAQRPVVGDHLIISAGPNAGLYYVTSTPFGAGFDRLEVDRPLAALETTVAYAVCAADSHRVTMNYDPAATSLGDVLLIGGRATKIVGLPGPTTIDVEDAVPFAGESFDYAMVIRSAILINATSPYPSFVPAVQGVYAVRLYVYDSAVVPPTRSDADVSIISVLAANTATGLPVDASWLWRSIADFWTTVSDKTWMETSWRTFIRAFGAMIQEAWNVQLSYSLGNCQDVMMSRWIGYEPLLEETNPDTALLNRRFVPVYSEELPVAGNVSILITVFDVPEGMSLPLTLNVTTLPDSFNAAMDAAGIAGVKARVEMFNGTRHLSIRSDNYVIEVAGIFGPGRRNHLEGQALRIDEHTLYLVTAPVTPMDFYKTNYDADLTLKKGDIINLGGTNFTIAAANMTDAGGVSYPFTYVSTEEEIPDLGIGYSYPFVVPSYFESSEVDYRDELVVPGDLVFVEVTDSAGVRTEGSETVMGAGFYRLGVTSPYFFCKDRTVLLKSVLRLFYVPIDSTHLSVPVLKEDAEARKGWKEYEHYVVSDRWGQRALVFDFNSELQDAGYPSVTRAFAPAVTDKPYPAARMWAEIVYVDQRPDLSARFGTGLGLELEDSPTRTGFSYQRALLGLWYCYIHGSKPGFIERGMSIICGAPFFEEDGVIIDARVLSAEKGYLVVRDLKHPEIVRGYVYPFSVGLDINPATGKEYAVGDTVRWFDTVSNAAIYQDYIRDPDFIRGLIAAGIITEPEKIHHFWLAVDADIIESGSSAAVRAAYEWLIGFRTTYNYPFFALLKNLMDDVLIHDHMTLKVIMHFVAYPGARWGAPMFDRHQLSGRMVPWGMFFTPALPPETGVHNYFDTVLDGREHYAAVRVDAGPPAIAKIEIHHVQPDGTIGDLVDPLRYGIIPGALFCLVGATPDPITVVTATDITLTLPAPLPTDNTYLFTISCEPISGKSNWAGFDDMVFYLRDYVHIFLRDMSGGAPGVLVDELIEPPPAGYPGPEPTSEVP